ncbi:MAG: molybdopterin-binding protein [Pseudomonadota bacterium]
MTTTPTAAMLVIGDEILSGRTRDSNMHFLAGELTRHNIPLCEVRVVADVAEDIVAAVQALAGRYTYVFTSGGIGPTHDDITADAVAAAFETPIDVREDARSILATHYAARGTEMNAARLRMARIPDGAKLIDNPVSAAPGFILQNVHVMAGVPSVFQAMVASVLPGLTGGPALLSQSVTLMMPEGELAGPLAALAGRYGEVSFGSYPFQRDGAFGAMVVARSTDGPKLDAAMADLAETFDLAGT